MRLLRCSLFSRKEDTNDEVKGWIAMVSGQAFVLYSRLNLVVRNQILLRCVLAAIIIDGFALHTPTLVFIYGANSPPAGKWIHEFNLMERIQLTGFSIQECVISSIYIVAIVRILGAVYYMRTRRAMLQLMAINFLCIAMDMILIGLEFSNNYFAQASVKPLIYATKLKLEFTVYRQLVGFTKATFYEQGEGDALARAVDNPGDIFKSLPNALRKPSVSTTPTITTHPELILRTKRADIRSMWDSSQIELSPSTIAAALTASGGRGGTGAPRKAKNLMGNPPDDSKPRPARRARIFDWGKSRNVDIDQRSDIGEMACQNGIGMTRSYET